MNPITDLVGNIERKGLWTKQLELDRNHFLKKQGSIDTNLYWVVQGSLRIYVVEENEEHTIRFGYTHNFIAALDSYLDEKPLKSLTRPLLWSLCNPPQKIVPPGN